MSKLTILIAEDEITFRHMLKTFVTRWGSEVVVRNDVLKA